MLGLFISGFIQVFMVSLNTYFITNKYWAGIAVCSFIISIFWTYNVSRKNGKVSFVNLSTRIAYAAGATLGGVTGAFLGYYLMNAI
jgi:hypothetical protein